MPFFNNFNRNVLACLAAEVSGVRQLLAVVLGGILLWFDTG